MKTCTPVGRTLTQSKLKLCNKCKLNSTQSLKKKKKGLKLKVGWNLRPTCLFPYVSLHTCSIKI